MTEQAIEFGPDRILNRIANIPAKTIVKLAIKSGLIIDRQVEELAQVILVKIQKDGLELSAWSEAIHYLKAATDMHLGIWPYLHTLVDHRDPKDPRRLSGTAERARYILQMAEK